VGTDYLEPNKKEKRRKIMMTYTMVMQMFFTVIGLSVLGIYIGRKMDPEGELATYLAAAGLFIGIFIGFMTLHQFIKSEERYERRKRN
jgi:hypothetical protein